jgi:hypothetical protein
MCILDTTDGQTDEPDNLSISFEEAIGRTDTPSPSADPSQKTIASARQNGRETEIPIREKGNHRSKFSFGRTADSAKKAATSSAAEAPKPPAHEHEGQTRRTLRPKFAFRKFKARRPTDSPLRNRP